jgi:hypothetical protein
MNTTSRRAALRKNRQITRVRLLESKGINMENWEGNGIKRNYVVFGVVAPELQKFIA